MRKEDLRKLRKRKRRIKRRLKPRNFRQTANPVFAATNPSYEVAERTRAVKAGGIGAIHALAKRSGLIQGIDDDLHLLKRHVPYHESDHVLNMAYNVLAGGTKLEDIELLRHDESYMDMLGTPRIPDPTTAGDFLRRFEEEDIICLMDVVNRTRARIWELQPESFKDEAIIDVDGTVVDTTGEKKEGMEYSSHKRIWGYHPLIISLANTKEPLFIWNRPGNAASHQDSTPLINKAIELIQPVFKSILIRGDTDFYLTASFDRWTDEGVRFVFGVDAMPNLKDIAEGLPASSWFRLNRRPKYEISTTPREKRENTKEGEVVKMGWRNIRLDSEDYAEVEYQPGKCRKKYRLIILRKNLSNMQGQQLLFEDCRYFFYITNDPNFTSAEVIWHANERCDQENLIEQLKNGVNALRVPVYDLLSNWAYMVIASLAWTLKAWFALTLPRVQDRTEILRMEFKRFINAVILVPCQVIRTGRRLVLRLLAYTDLVRLLFRSMDATRRLNFG